jgi:hypothetical protein
MAKQKKRWPDLAGQRLPVWRIKPKLDHPVRSSSSEPLAILTAVFPYLLQPGSLLFGEQSCDLLARVLSRLPQLLAKFTCPRTICFGQCFLPSPLYQFLEFFTRGAIPFEIFATKRLRLLRLSIRQIQLSKRPSAHACTAPHHHSAVHTAALLLPNSWSCCRGGLRLGGGNHEAGQYRQQDPRENCEFLHSITPQNDLD